MKIYRFVCLAVFFVTFTGFSFAQSKSNEESFLQWNAKTAQEVGEGWRVKGRVGGFFDLRIRDTNNSFNYKLRATLMAPEAIKAAARMEQIHSRLTDEETKKIVSETNRENLVVIIEIDPREGSGVIPSDWQAFLGSKEDSAIRDVRGTVENRLRSNKALQLVSKRDYDYEVFWISFSLTDKDGSPLWTKVPNELELSVRISDKEGRVKWKITNDLKIRIENLLKRKTGQ